jgi:hypothetical protein
MGYVSIFVCMLLCGAILGIWCVLNRLGSNRGGTGNAFAKGLRVVSGHKLRRMNLVDLARLKSSDPDMVVFRLVDEKFLTEESSRLPGELDVTLPDLEEALPWIPRGNRITIYRPGGIDLFLERRLTAILRHHEAVVLSGKLIQMPENFEAMTGGVCN